LKITFFFENLFYTLTLDTYEHCRHRWTFVLFDGVVFSLLVEIGVGRGIGISSIDVDFDKVFGVCVWLCSSRADDESQ